jgi:O-antigen ligase
MYRDRTIDVSAYWDKAHNSYLEVFQGLGMIFGLMLIGTLGFFFLSCAIGSLRRRRDATPPLVASAACVLVGVHALVDFSLQMQGVTLTFMALLGAGFAQATSSRRNLSD